MTTTLYIVSQVFVVISYLLVAITYLVKNRKLILIYCFASVLANAVAYFFLSAWSGLAMCGVAILRNIIFLLQNKYYKSEKINWLDWLILAALVVISAVFAWITYQGPLSLLSVFATLTYTVSVWQKNHKVYRAMGVAVSVLWIVYFIFIWSIFSIILESVLLVVEIISTIRAFGKPKSETTIKTQQSSDEKDIKPENDQNETIQE